MNTFVTIQSLYTYIPQLIVPLFEGKTYPWEVLSQIHSFILRCIDAGLPGYEEIEAGVWAGEGVTVARTAVLIGPAIIGPGTEIRPGAYIRGDVITGSDCVMGNSSEFKNCVLMDHVQAPHYNYVGDSVLGNYAHMGAGSICSNLKSGGSEVVIHADPDINTGRRKIGGLLGDHADIGCGSVINPGTIVGQNTSVYPLTSLRGVMPANCIVKDMNTIVARRD